MIIDMLMDYDEAVSIVKSLGWGGWYRHMSALFPARQLYCTSTEWLQNSEYIAKLRGVYGDVIVGWKK